MRALAEALISSGGDLHESGLPNTRLRWLGLARTGIEQEGLQHIVKLMTTRDIAIETLQLQHNGLPAGAAPLLARIVAGSQSLTDIDISENPLGPAGVARIALALRTNTNIVSIR